MNGVSRLSCQVMSFVKDNSWQSLKVQQKKIALIALTIICALSACYLLYCTLKKKQVNLIEKNQPIQVHEKILEETQLYKSEKGDFYLRISNNHVPDSGKQLLGERNFAKLKEHDNFLWSPDGKSFYFMQHKGYGGTNINYYARFETEEGNVNSNVKMEVNNNQAVAVDNNGKQLATYERQDLDSVRGIFANLKVQEDLMIPLITARKPEYLFKMENGQYIYVDANYAKGDLDFKVYMGTQGDLQRYFSVEDVMRYKDGGTTIITLSNGACLYSPSSFKREQVPYFQFPNDPTRHILAKLDEKIFDYSSIGIELEPMNPRHTMLDLFPKEA